MAGWIGYDGDGNGHGNAIAVPKSWSGKCRGNGWMDVWKYVYILDIRGRYFG